MVKRGNIDLAPSRRQSRPKRATSANIDPAFWGPSRDHEVCYRCRAKNDPGRVRCASCGETMIPKRWVNFCYDWARAQPSARLRLWRELSPEHREYITAAYLALGYGKIAVDDRGQLLGDDGKAISEGITFWQVCLILVAALFVIIGIVAAAI